MQVQGARCKWSPLSKITKLSIRSSVISISPLRLSARLRLILPKWAPDGSRGAGGIFLRGLESKALWMNLWCSLSFRGPTLLYEALFSPSLPFDTIIFPMICLFRHVIRWESRKTVRDLWRAPKANSYKFMNRWLQNFVYRTNIGLWTFLLAGVLALFIALMTVS